MPGQRGGSRAGRPNASYPNRSDLQGGPRSAPVEQMRGLTYGTEKDLTAVARAAPPPGGRPPAPMSLDAPTQRPWEDVASGLPIGAGPGPEALGMGEGALGELRALYLTDPSESLREILEELEGGG